MRISLLILLLLSCVSYAMAQPRLLTENLSFDFGEVRQGDSVEHRFRFQNSGDQPLELSNLRSSCGCTAALLSARRLEPGAMGELQVTFDSRGFQGPVQKQVTVDTNDPEHPVLNFSLRGRVIPEFYVDPPRANWPQAVGADPLRMELQVHNNSSRTVTLEKPAVTSNQITADLARSILASGETGTLLITAHPSPERKRVAGYVILQSDFPGVPQLRIPVSARWMEAE